MSRKNIFIILIGGFIALLLMNTNIEVTAEDFPPTPTPIPDSACPAGKYANESTNYVCVDADPGYYVPEANATEQSACPLGRYQPSSGAINCLLAEPGNFVDTTAAVAQTACSPGTYQPNAGAMSCLAADPGYYVPGSAATEQLACPAGYTSEAAATECTLIEEGYTFTGFFAPVDMAALNVVKAGRAIPIKFSLGGDYGLDIMAASYPTSAPVACDSSLLLDTVEETVSAGSSSLSYNPDSDQYTYVWKTNKGWANSCRIFTIILDDGSVHQASFSFTR